MTVALSQEKKEQIQQLARQVESSEDRFLRAKDLASFIGKVAAAEPALGSIVPITTRRAYQDLDEVIRQFGWSGKIKISAEVAEDFGRFRQRIDEFNGTPIRTQATEIAVVSIIGEPSEFIKQKFIKNHKRQKEMEIWAGDASATAVCAFSVSGEQPFFFKRRLTSEEQKKSSGMRELLTVRYVLQDMEEEASGLRISLVPIHLRREDPRIKIADAGSKSANSDDWSIDDESFRRLEKKFGTFSVDLFADQTNHKVCKFYSAYYSPKSAGVEAFSQDWTEEKAWICPPVNLVIKVIRKIKSEKLSGLLIVPDWDSAYYRPFIFQANGVLKWPFIQAEAFHPTIQQTSGAKTGFPDSIY
jgi:hypothetical protein